jgi:hypothetical protein
MEEWGVFMKRNILGLSICLLFLGAPTPLLWAQLDLQYQKRGDGDEGVKPNTVSIYDFELGSVLADVSPEMVLTEDQSWQKAIMELDGCRVSLERRKVESDLLHFRHDCHQTLSEKLDLLKAMIKVLVPDLEGRRTIHTLFVGRLYPTFTEFAQRLGKVASESPEWDPKRPWKEPGYSNRFVFQLMRQENLFPELQKALDGFGYKVQVASVEKILIAKPKDIPFGSWLLEQGADPNTKLPFDAMTWFYLKPIENSESSSE